MPYPFLKFGDRLPAVAVAQKLLNSRVPTALRIDGKFDGRTKEAVRKFQNQHRLPQDGVIGEKTWKTLSQRTKNLRIIDCVDIFDTDDSLVEPPAIRYAGGKPIVVGGMSNGVEDVVNEIIKVGGKGGVFMLRFHGHGQPGKAGIAIGKSKYKSYNLLESSNGKYLFPLLTKLSKIFGPCGCIQLMHCDVGRKDIGRNLLKNISGVVGVPVTAGIYTQYGGGHWTFKFEGPTRTAFPSGLNFKSWSQTRLDFEKMSVGFTK